MPRTIRTLAASIAALALAGTIAAAAVAAAPLSADERSTLVSMRGEEKLARDAYAVFAVKWGDRVFANVARSEARHEQAVERAMSLYGIADPTDGLAAGEFASSELQALYASLVAEGSVSRAAAPAVGVRIERLDIAELRQAIRETDEPELDRMYSNLLAASQNHLAAFERAAAGTQAAAGPASGSGGEQRRRGPGC